MLLALVFRGVAFEFREIGANKALWNTAFAGGSTLAGFVPGRDPRRPDPGHRGQDGAYAGGTFDWATPFALLCGLGVVFGLCAAWRDLADDENRGAAGRPRGRRRTALCSRCWASWQRSACGRRSHFPGSGALVLAAEFLLSLAGAAFDRTHRVRCLAVIAQGRRYVPFIATIGLFLLGFLGLAISSFPYLVPPSLTIWQTAAAPSSQTFMLAGTVVLLPLILAYTGYVYWLFRGKIGPGENYHWPAGCRRRARPDHAPADAQSGMRPWNCRSNARGTSTARSETAAKSRAAGGRRCRLPAKGSPRPFRDVLPRDMRAIGRGRIPVQAGTARRAKRDQRSERLVAADQSAAARCGARSSRRSTPPLSGRPPERADRPRRSRVGS